MIRGVAAGPTGPTIAIAAIVVVVVAAVCDHQGASGAVLGTIRDLDMRCQIDVCRALGGGR
jgi:hypothetical protein